MLFLLLFLILSSCKQISPLLLHNDNIKLCIFTELKEEYEFDIIRNIKTKIPYTYVNEFAENQLCDTILFFNAYVFGNLFYDTSQIPIAKNLIFGTVYSIFQPSNNDKKNQIIKILLNQEVPKKNKFLRSSFRGIAIKKMPLMQAEMFEMERKNNKYELNLSAAEEIEKSVLQDNIVYTRSISINMNLLNNDYEMYRDNINNLSYTVAEKIVNKINTVYFHPKIEER